jgi:hypothetical protein
MSRLIFSLLPRTTDGGEFSSPRQQELGQFRFMRMRPSRGRWSCYKRRSTEYRTRTKGPNISRAESGASPCKYHCDCDRPVYYDSSEGVLKAIGREKQLKGWIRAKENCIDESEESAMGRLGGEVGLADGVGRGSDQRQVRELLDTPLPEYARMGSCDCVSVRFTIGNSAPVTDYSNGNYY